MARFSGMNPRVIDWERLDRYIAAEGTPEELEALRRWVESNPELQVVAEVMRTAQRRPGAAPASWDPRNSWVAVAERLGLPADASSEPAIVPGPPRPGRGATRPVLRLAAVGRDSHLPSLRAVAALAAAVVGLVVGADRWAEHELARHARDGGASAEAGREYVTLRGQRLVVHLPDRTQITLAPESRLRLSPGYDRGPRIVDLAGQAYFVVTHDSTRPFSVKTDRLIARDLGTRFLVRAYPADSTPDVVVAEGLVALGRSGAADSALPDSVLLEPGDLGRLTLAGGIDRRRGVPVEQYLAWTGGELVFRGTLLRDAVAELGRWYDVDIRLADPSLGREEVTASFKDELAPAVIGLVAAAAGLVVEQRGTQFILRRKRG